MKDELLKKERLAGGYLDTIDGETLLAKHFAELEFTISQLMTTGLYIIAGAPKVGKSWLAMWLCKQVATGQNVWDFKTSQGTILYLCLEDTDRRIQNRLSFIADDDSLSALHFATHAFSMSAGLEKNIGLFVKEHSDTRLVVIDTIQKKYEMRQTKMLTPTITTSLEN